MNSRQRMRSSNKKAIQYLLQQGYDEIWLKSHTLRKDTTYCQKYNYKNLDLWNLFDGICIKDEQLWFLQISTNKYHSIDKYIDFINKCPINVIMIMVKLVKNRWQVFTKIL